MKLLKTESPYLDKSQWRKLFLALSIMTICLYIVAMMFSLCGSKYFILDYQNAQMDKIEAFMKQYKIISLISGLFLTIESYIILCFTLNKCIKIWYALAHYATMITIAVLFPRASSTIYTLVSIIFYTVCPIINQLIEVHKTEIKFSFKRYLKELLKLFVALVVTFILQLMIYVIKGGYFSVENHILPLTGYFIYSLEYDIALLVILFTISLYINREKGDSTVWATSQVHYGFS
jgi:hypothetical protein